MNLSTIARSAWRVAQQPNLLMPHAIYDTFDQLPLPLSRAFPSTGEKPSDIRAVILDKDNCFAQAGTNNVHASCQATFQSLIDIYGQRNVLIVSNSSGFAASDPHGLKLAALEKATSVKVLKHTLRKPACGDEALEYFSGTVTHPSQVAIIGDRLWTDVLMGNLMHARSIWIRRGVEVDSGLLTRFEYGLFSMLSRRHSRI